MAGRVRGFLLLLVAGSALAAGYSIKDFFDATRKAFPLRHWVWEQWEELDKKTRVRSKGTDPADWVDPPADPPEPPDPEAEERKRKAAEKRQKQIDAGLLPKYPQNRWPGFRFEDRLEAKRTAFEKLIGPAAASTLEGLVKQLGKLDKLKDKLDKQIAEATEEYHKATVQVDKAAEPFVKQYTKKHGKPPSVVQVPRILLQAQNRKSKRLQELLALHKSELEFDAWFVGRLGELIAELSPDERGKPVAALGMGVLHKDWRYRLRCAEVLGRLGDEGAVAAFTKALQSEKDPLVLAELVRIRAGRGGDGLLALLAERLDDTEWTVRAAVVRELARLRTKEAVDLLVQRMQSEKGRLLDDIAAALRMLSGKDFVPEPDPWRIWWEKSRATWVAPKQLKPGEVAAAQEGQGFVYFFGIRSSSRRVVFCIDISGSMAFPLDGEGGKQPARILTAKRELLNALQALPEDALFNIVVYSSDVKVWKKRMQTADRKRKAAARRFVEKLEPAGATNIFDALVTSLEQAASLEKRDNKDPEVDTIFFLTDGVPTHGKVIEPIQILEEITRRNKVLGLVIHCVGVSKEQNKGFLFNLAKRNNGQYAAHR